MTGLLAFLLMGPPVHVVDVPVYVPVRRQAGAVVYVTYERITLARVVRDWSDYGRIMRLLWGF